MALQTRSPTYQEKTTQLTLAAACVALVPQLVNARVMIPLNTTAISVQNSFLIAGQISDYVQAAVVIAAGDKIYWDNGAQAFTNVVGANTLCGYALEPSASASGLGIIDFNSFAA